MIAAKFGDSAAFARLPLEDEVARYPGIPRVEVPDLFILYDASHLDLAGKVAGVAPVQSARRSSQEIAHAEVEIRRDQASTTHYDGRQFPALHSRILPLHAVLRSEPPAQRPCTCVLLPPPPTVSSNTPRWGGLHVPGTPAPPLQASLVLPVILCAPPALAIIQNYSLPVLLFWNSLGPPSSLLTNSAATMFELSI